MNQPLFLEHAQQLMHPVRYPLFRPGEAATQFVDQFPDSLPSIEKIRRYEIFRWNEIKTGPHVIVKQQSENLLTDLNVCPEIENCIRSHDPQLMPRMLPMDFVLAVRIQSYSRP